MPEGHVIHRLARELNAGFTDGAVEVSSPQGRFAVEASLLDGHGISRAEAIGKHLFIEFDAPHPEHIIYIHLGLIGQLTFDTAEQQVGQIRLRIRAGDVAAHLRGPQWCRLITDEEYAAIRKKAGEDPIRTDADPEALWPRVNRSRRTIGSQLMDQKLFAGVGNIYRAETLFRLGVSPFIPGTQLTKAEFDSIWLDLVGLMAEGVASGRIDTVREEHTPEAMARKPRRDDHGGEVYVYRRAGLPCYVCGALISHRVMEGRNLFWCPSCQGGD